MKYKAVALDLDGTLLGSNLQIHPEVAQAIQATRAAGLQVVMVTGRHHTAALPYHRELALDTPLMCCNGSYAWDARSQSALSPRPLSREQAFQTLALIREHEIHALLYVDNAMTYETVEPHLHRLLTWADTVHPDARPLITQLECFEQAIEAANYVWKFALTSPDLPRLSAFGQAVEQAVGVSCEWSARDRVDVAQCGNSKGRLLTEWLQQQGIAPEDVIAFGDSPNDLSMLQAVGLGVAMSHSKDAVRAAASLITGSNDSPAIATVLHQHVLNARPV